MPALPPPQLYHLIGFNPTGDLGPFTFYTKANGTVVWFLKAPPKTPPTPWQLRNMELWTVAAAEWRSMNPTLKAAWHQVQRLAHLGITSYNLWIWFFCTNNRPAIRTIEHQTGLTLLSP